MKTKSVIVLAILLAVVTTSSRCIDINMKDGVTGSKNYITRDFKVGNFNKLKLSTVADIVYTPSTDGSTSLELYGPDNIVELVNVEVKDNTLILNMKKKNIKKSNLKIKISSPTIQSLEMHGVGNFSIKEPFQTDNLTIRNSGVGDIKIEQITCANLDLVTEGVGNIRIIGKTDKATLISKGVGSIDADEFIASDVTTVSDGVGSISCHATQSIDAKVNGVGSISYYGNPAKKNTRKNGIGSIKQK